MVGSQNLLLLVCSMLLIIGAVNCLGFDLVKSENYCFKVSVNQTDNIRISYSISGKGDNKVLTQFYNPQNAVINDYTTKKHGFVNHVAETPGIYRMCFMRQDMNVKKVTLNMHVAKGTSEKAKEEDVNSIVTRLESIRSDLNRVQENLEEMQQSAITKKCETGLFETLDIYGSEKNTKLNPSLECLATKSSSKVKYFTIFKIFVILLIAIVQTYFVIKFFNTNQKTRLPFHRVQNL
ncbi:unnamed protein product [Moneuplotes crassus]|uniref:GOLD domain-containing protein n=1 Tax=Euplotes crassus TaxID=5936 RepID=A0AAD1XW73_EUPCR|nr:unnamed protein product [Moneuplotes crassus]